ncbi:acid phosphatase type 7-like isoform X2 [Macrobrachium rosenbergii]
MRWIRPFLFVLYWIGTSASDEGTQPDQIHLSYADDGCGIVVSWVTQNITGESVVEYGTTSLNARTEGRSSLFEDGGNETRRMYMHGVHLTDLQADTRYFYHCGSDRGWSDIFTFKTPKAGNKWPMRVAMYGDMGVVNAQSLTRLQEDVTRGMYDAIIHVGDFAYNLDDDNARVGDHFMRQIEPVAGYVPYMTCPGNHEQEYNFSNYKARFVMPNYDVSESMFYSWNFSFVHFISINTEAYYYLEYGQQPLSNQWQWLIGDLEQATKPGARAEHPWIILYGHRPMYCSNRDTSRDCRQVGDVVRVGIEGVFGIEDLLYKYGVDLAVWGHQHSYERMFPMYNYTVLNGSAEEPYVNPRGPVHFTTGSAGCQEELAPFSEGQPEWSAFRALDYGYTRLTVFNETHLYWEQVSDDQNGEIIDSTWLVRDKHGPFLRSDLNNMT